MVRYMEGDTFKFEVHMKLAIIKNDIGLQSMLNLPCFDLSKKNHVPGDCLRPYYWRRLQQEHWVGWREDISGTPRHCRPGFKNFFSLFGKDVNIHPVLPTGLVVLFCNSAILPLHLLHFRLLDNWQVLVANNDNSGPVRTDAWDLLQKLYCFHFRLLDYWQVRASELWYIS